MRTRCAASSRRRSGESSPAPDGIDYIESSSAQGVSTITVHLKLNYDTNAALTQVQAKVAQVRNDLPPEAEAPIINMETADNQFAAIYLGFSSNDLDPNQITDYLTRVVQPKLSAISGVQRADILGARTFAMRIWLKPDRWRRTASPSIFATRRRTTTRPRWDRQRAWMVGQSRGQHRFADAQRVRQLVVRSKAASGCDIADIVLGAENTAGHPLQRRVGDLHGRLGAPDGEFARRDREVREALPHIKEQPPGGMQACR